MVTRDVGAQRELSDRPKHDATHHQDGRVAVRARVLALAIEAPAVTANAPDGQRTIASRKLTPAGVRPPVGA